MFGLAFLLVICLGVIALFNTGQLVNRKVELNNTADAAAYSLAVQQARVLNLNAYLNRAQVANHVAVAQLISMYSWLNMVQSTTANFQRVTTGLSWIPIAGQVLAAIGQALRAVEQVIGGIRTTYRTSAGLSIRAIDLLNRGYSLAADTVMNGVSQYSGLQLAEQVVKSNSEHARISGTATALLATQYLNARRDYRRYGIGNTGRQRTDAERLRNVVMESRDRFSADRRSGGSLLGSRGGTDLVEYNRWAALDGFQLNFDVLLGTVRAPIGWGGAQALQGTQRPRFLQGMNNGRGWTSPYDERRYAPYGHITHRNTRNAARLGNTDPNVRISGGQPAGAYFSGYSGLRPYYDTADGRARTPDDGSIFSVMVELDGERARTSQSLEGLAGGRLELEDSLQSNTIRASASAQVYFNRPPDFAPFIRDDRRLEHGNLFSPYWQARLVDHPAWVRVALFGASMGT